ncbi:DUF2069 domain-containing protein [Thalassotalea litorea]|uniref:DUF2069 domain-containing protein n=1 Tax=Thalassotalea litorea TaxID=2020715 RepID=UPI0037366888
MSKQTFSTPTLKRIALTGYFGLLVFMPLWLMYLSPSEGLSPVLSVAMFVIPLLFPLPGMIKGNPYTYAWANFIVMIYFLHSLTTLWVSPEERLLAVVELLLASMMFFAGTYYSKYKGQELGLGLKKNGKEKK